MYALSRPVNFGTLVLMRLIRWLRLPRDVPSHFALFVLFASFLCSLFLTSFCLVIVLSFLHLFRLILVLYRCRNSWAFQLQIWGLRGGLHGGHSTQGDCSFRPGKHAWRLFLLQGGLTLSIAYFIYDSICSLRVVTGLWAFPWSLFYDSTEKIFRCKIWSLLFLSS